jgi:hypothetical protein
LTNQTFPGCFWIQWNIDNPSISEISAGSLLEITEEIPSGLIPSWLDTHCNEETC